MTANELIVYLEDITDSEESPYRQAATMLRQQQAEIEELKTIRGNSVLVPSDKLQAMQVEIEALKLRELTDEEIEELSEQHLDWNWQTGNIDFARAILRKASKK